MNQPGGVPAPPGFKLSCHGGHNGKVCSRYRHADYGRSAFAVGSGATALFLALRQEPSSPPPGHGWMVQVLEVSQTIVTTVPVLVGAMAVVAIALRKTPYQNSARKVSQAWRAVGHLHPLAFFFFSLTAGILLLAPIGDVREAAIGLTDATASVGSVMTLYFAVLSQVSVAALSPAWAKRVVFSAMPFLLLSGLTQSQGELLEAIQHALFFGLYNLVHLYAMLWVIGRCEQLDTSERESAAQRIALANQRGVTLAKERADDFVHDEVLSVLLLVSKGEIGALSMAATSNSLMEKLCPDSPIVTANCATELKQLLSEELTHCSEPVAVEAAIENDFLLVSGVSRALQDAVKEAVRNSLRHAGTSGQPVQRKIRLQSDANALSVEVWDNGVGFNHAAASNRHGLANSIKRRAQESGIEVKLKSAPGQGTSIVFRVRAVESKHAPFQQLLLSSVARRFAPLAILYIAVATVFQWNAYTVPGVQVAALALMAGAVWGVMRPQWKGSRPRLTAALIVGAVLVSTGLQNAFSTSPTIASWDHWAPSVGVFVLCALLLRGLPGFGWAGMVGICLLSVASTAHFAQDWNKLTEYLAGHVFQLIIWHVFSAWSERASQSIAAENHHSNELEYWMQVEGLAQKELNRTRSELRARIQPLLIRLVNGEGASAAVRLEAQLLEAELRDELRAACFTRTPVARCARQLRAQGLEVILLDDSKGALPAAEQQQVVQAATQALERVRERGEPGRVVVRVPPATRDCLLQVSQAGIDLVVVSRA